MEEQANQTNVNQQIDAEYLSEEGFAKLRGELENLKTKERLKIAERLEYAKGLGDLSENAEFDAAKEDQMLNEMRIRELEDLLSRASIIPKNHTAATTVQLGSNIVISSGKGKEDKYTIVGTEEANPMLGLISHESPLGKAFLGRKKGDKVKVVTPRGETEYVIREIA
jgi:transcription elongation factor GreA